MTSRVSAIIFQRNEENVVEFFLYPDFSGRYVNNSDKLKTNGVELEATYFFNNLKIIIVLPLGVLGFWGQPETLNLNL